MYFKRVSSQQVSEALPRVWGKVREALQRFEIGNFPVAQSLWQAIAAPLSANTELCRDRQVASPISCF